MANSTVESRLDAELLISRLEKLAGTSTVISEKHICPILSDPDRIDPNVLTPVVACNAYPSAQRLRTCALYDALSADREAMLDNLAYRRYDQTVLFMESQGLSSQQMNNVFYLLSKITENHNHQLTRTS